MARNREVVLIACDVMIVLLLAVSLTLLIIGVKDNIAIWEGFGVAFLFMYWKSRFKIYIVRRERERLCCYESK